MNNGSLVFHCVLKSKDDIITTVGSQDNRIL